MYLKKFEYFILDSSVAGTLLLIALAIRIETVNAGFDQFSSNIIFISVFIIQYFGKFLPINKNKTIESVLAGSKLH